MAACVVEDFYEEIRRTIDDFRSVGETGDRVHVAIDADDGLDCIE